MVRDNESMLALSVSSFGSFHQIESQEDAASVFRLSRPSDIPTSVSTEASGGMALKTHASHEYFRGVAAKLRKSLNHRLPRMDVRFRNLSVSVKVPVVAEDTSVTTASYEIPTVWTTARNAVTGRAGTTAFEVRHLLNDISGVLRPGTVTLVLGQAGSGKSTLLKALSGRLPLVHSGEIAYNDLSEHAIKTRLPQLASYVTQSDIHHPTLTVHETLAFANACCTSGLARDVSRVFSKSSGPEEHAAASQSLCEWPRLVLEMLGLQNCKDTAIGDAMTRGVSGGERRRTTTGEMLFGTKLVLCLDDISTGLDSAATFDIVSSLRSVAQSFGTTVAISLLQPSPEVLALFDDVILLSDGELLYHGPQQSVLPYFDEIGLVCPADRDAADFLLDLATDAQTRYETDQHRPGSGFAVPRTPEQFAAVFRASTLFRDTSEMLDAVHDDAYLEVAQTFVDGTPEFRQSFWASTAHVLRRELTLASRNSAFIKGRVAMIALMGLLYSNMFYSFDPKQIQVVMGITFSASLFVSLGQASQVPVLLAARDVFYKQRRANFYRTSSLVLSNAISRLPVSVVESVVFGGSLYWLCGFSSHVPSFLAFELLFFLTSVTMGSWFYFLTAALPSTTVVIPFSLLSMFVSTIFSGFFIPKDRIADYLVWLYWFTPMSWCVRGVIVNQYQSPEFAACTYDHVDYCKQFNATSAGTYFLSLYDVPPETDWVVGGMVYMVGMTGLLGVAAVYVLEYRRYETQGIAGIVKRTGDAAVKSKVSEDSGDTTFLVQSDSMHLAVQLKPPQEAHFAPVTLAFQNLWYTVPLKARTKDDPTRIDLLKGVSGFATPGSMTALMGASGAGKTTLMDVIAGRKTGGAIQGRIFINGHVVTDTVIQRCAGYCEQMDVHSEASTFREALTFSAFLRQPSVVPDSVKFDSVDECLDLLDLHAIADKLIRGSSMEQMKRLTIGVELAAQPSVLFMDEPTSGLDAQSAKSIMDGVRKVADSGRTIMCTIHQPSAEVFDVFDNLLLLQKGGEAVYFGAIGENKRTLVSYFERIPGVSPLPRGYNAATWVLECIGAGVGNASGSRGRSSSSSAAASTSVDFVRTFNESDLQRALDRFLDHDGVTRPSPGVKQLSFSTKRASSEWTQAKFLVARALASYWRTPSYNLTRFAIALVLALIFAVLFAGAKYETYQEVNAGVGMVCLSTIFCGMVAFFSVLPVAFAERAAFYRERASQTYNALWYFLGITVAEIPYALASSFIYTLIFFPTVGFTGVRNGLLYWLNTALLTLMQTYSGQLLAFALPTEELALLVSVLFNTIFFLFMGFNPPASAIPEGLKWVYHGMPKRYSFTVLAALTFANCPSGSPASDNSTHIGCHLLVGAPPNVPYVRVKDYVENVFGAKHDDIPSNIGVVLLAIVVIRVLGLLALRFINHQKK